MDWAGLLVLGLRELRLAPEAFWKLTPVELVTMLGLDAARPALTRARLDELARAYPDSKKECGNEY